MPAPSSKPKSSSFARSLKIIAGSCFLAGIGTYLYASRIESRRYQLEKVKLTTGGANDNNGDLRSRQLRILHLSDLHLCAPESHKIEFLQKITCQDYDIVVLTGDIFENYSGLIYASRILAKKPRLGAYAVLGNHDYYDYTMVNKTFGRLIRRFRHPKAKRDVVPMVEALEEGGFTVLRNQAKAIPEHGVYVMGIDYPGIEDELLRKLASAKPEGHFMLTLFHVPQGLEKLSLCSIDLAVGGHTHGGQIRIPGYGAIITDSELPRRMASGLFFLKETAFHISRGLGADPRTNFRLFCPPAATILEVTHYPQ